MPQFQMEAAKTDLFSNAVRDHDVVGADPATATAIASDPVSGRAGELTGSAVRRLVGRPRVYPVTADCLKR